MPEMGRLERAWCRSPLWRGFTQRVAMPWALQDTCLAGKVLEIGGGSGAMAEALHERFPHARLVVTDYDPMMVDTAQRRLQRTNPTATVTRADATDLPFPDGYFDGLVSFIMLHHVIDWQAALTEASRVLRPGGILVGYDLTASTPARWMHQVQRKRQRMITIAEMRRQLAALPFDEHSVTSAFLGLAMRFRAVRSRNR